MAEHAKRARVVNRAYGTQLTPAQIAQSIPDETVEALLLLEEENYIADSTTLLRVWLEAMARR